MPDLAALLQQGRRPRQRMHVPAALHPRRTLFAPRQQQAQRRPSPRPRRPRLGRQMQPPHRRQARGGRHLGHDQRHHPRSQRFFHRPQDILHPPRPRTDQPPRIGKARHPVGIKPLGLPARGDPQHRPRPFPHHLHRQRHPRRAAEFMHPSPRKPDARRRPAGHRQHPPRRRGMAGKDRQTHASHPSLFRFCSQPHPCPRPPPR